jgi:hypothetical protein
VDRNSIKANIGQDTAEFLTADCKFTLFTKRGRDAGGIGEGRAGRGEGEEEETGKEVKKGNGL